MVAKKEGWTGRVYEDFEVGDIYMHPLGRTILAADNVWFTLLTQNTNPVHFDYCYAANTELQPAQKQNERSETLKTWKTPEVRR